MVVTEISAERLSFAAAVNRGIERARFSHICLLNNDMVLIAASSGRWAKPSTAFPISFAPPHRFDFRTACAAKKRAKR